MLWGIQILYTPQLTPFQFWSYTQLSSVVALKKACTTVSIHKTTSHLPEEANWRTKNVGQPFVGLGSAPDPAGELTGPRLPSWWGWACYPSPTTPPRGCSRVLRVLLFVNGETSNLLPSSHRKIACEANNPSASEILCPVFSPSFTDATDVNHANGIS